jgi:hypothetical protein
MPLSKSRKRSPIFAASLSVATLLTGLALPLSEPAFGQEGGQQSMSSQAPLPGPSDELLAKLEEIYKDIHANPELAMQERRTARVAADWLREQGYEVTQAWAAPAWWGFCETARAQRSCCARTWMPFP